MRGYQKKIIFLKNSGSDIFEEAYFVIKGDEKSRIFSHATMVSEAKRIIEENFGTRKRRFKFFSFKILISFLLGFSIAFFLTLLFF